MWCTPRLLVITVICSGALLTAQTSLAETREYAEGQSIVASGWSSDAHPEISVLLDDLHDAKKAGDMDAARAIEVELARLRGRPASAPPADETPDPGFVIRHAADGEPPASDRWESEDILIRGTSRGEVKPAIAGDSQGRLWVAFELVGTNSIVLCRSLNGGEYWTFFASLSHPSIAHTNVTLAIGEGNEDWLLVAIQYSTTDIWIWRNSIDEPRVFDTPHVYECPDGLSNPRIVTDATEYGAWYAYMVFNVMTVEGWAVCFSRSTDYGAHWQEMPDIIGWHCQGWNAEDSRPNIDFGSSTLYAAYSTPVLPCSDQNREIFVTRSTDFGVNWTAGVRLTTNDDLDFEPTVGAIKNYLTAKTAVIAYTRFYHELDYDVWFTYTQDGGATWSTNRCLSCIEVENERAPDMETSVNCGALHAAYHHDNMIDYAAAAYTTPQTWVKQTHINDGLDASSDYPKPGVAVNPTRPTTAEAGICWTDQRNLATTSYDIYYDGPGTTEAGAPEGDIGANDALTCCGPNPFTTATRVCLDLSEPAIAKLFVSDVTGRVVRTLAEGTRPAGRQVVTWNGLGTGGSRLPTGIYFIRLETERTAAARSVTLIR